MPTGPCPLTSFGIPAFNRPRLLAEALASIATQTASAGMVVVCDDGNLEETRQIGRRFSRRTVPLYREPTAAGRDWKWNRCLGAARGQWVTILHEDDALFPWYLGAVLPRLRENLAAVCTQTVQGPEPPRLEPPGNSAAVWTYPPAYFLKGSMTPPFPGVLMRREIALGLGGFEPGWGPLADYEFWYRLARAGPVEVVRIPAAFYRVASGQWTERTWSRMLRLTHLLRLRIARDQFPSAPRRGRWLARFFTFRNAKSYARRFTERPAALARALRLGAIPFSGLPSSWSLGGIEALTPKVAADLRAAEMRLATPRLRRRSSGRRPPRLNRSGQDNCHASDRRHTDLQPRRISTADAGGGAAAELSRWRLRSPGHRQQFHR